MDKDFDSWNRIKKIAHDKNRRIFYKRREIWWCLLGVNIGQEHDGDSTEYMRPVIVLKGLSLETCFVIPLTSSTSKHQMRIPIGFVKDKEASVVISQLRIIDTKRLVEKIGILETKKFEIIRKAVKDLL